MENKRIPTGLGTLVLLVFSVIAGIFIWRAVKNAEQPAVTMLKNGPVAQAPQMNKIYKNNKFNFEIYSPDSNKSGGYRATDYTDAHDLMYQAIPLSNLVDIDKGYDADKLLLEARTSTPPHCRLQNGNNNCDPAPEFAVDVLKTNSANIQDWLSSFKASMTMKDAGVPQSPESTTDASSPEITSELTHIQGLQAVKVVYNTTGAQKEEISFTAVINKNYLYEIKYTGVLTTDQTMPDEQEQQQIHDQNMATLGQITASFKFLNQ